MTNLLLIIGLLLAALSAGVALTHLLEIPGKRTLAPATAVTAQQWLYVGYRVPGAVLEFGSLLVLAVGAILLSGEGAEFWFTLAAFGALLAATIVFLAWTNRQNHRIAKWRPEQATQRMPKRWVKTRRRWETSHGVRAALFLVGVGLVAGALVER